MAQTSRCVECRCVDIANSKCKLTGREVKLEAERHCKKFGRAERNT